MSQTILRLKWLQLLLQGEDTAENRERVVEGRGFFSTLINLFGMPEKHIVWTYAKPCYF